MVHGRGGLYTVLLHDWLFGLVVRGFDTSVELKGGGGGGGFRNTVVVGRVDTSNPAGNVADVRDGQRG